MQAHTLFEVCHGLAVDFLLAVDLLCNRLIRSASFGNRCYDTWWAQLTPDTELPFEVRSAHRLLPAGQ